MNRTAGYYWVKVLGKWTVEEWDGSKWNDHRCQDGNDYYVSFFEEIDERMIEREQTVDEENAPNDIHPPTEEELEGYRRILDEHFGNKPK